MPSLSKSSFASVGADPHSLSRWLNLQALPLWFTVGRYDNGSFAEALTANGENPADFQRARVSTRQIYVLAQALQQGWGGPSRTLLDAGLTRYWEQFAKAEGDFRTLVTLTGEPLDNTTWLYDQAFSLLAMASAAAVGIQADECRRRSVALLDRLRDRAAPGGGWTEAGTHTFQANAHMHVLEACLAWDKVDPSGPWLQTAALIVELAMTRFIDSGSGALHEFFERGWDRKVETKDELVEPGHQFEWAWLLMRFALRTGDDAAKTASLRLYEVGSLGVLPDRAVACDELDGDLSVRSSRARLWPQTEWLKAALLLNRVNLGDPFAGDIARARAALAGYLLPDGRWYDKQVDHGEYVDEPAPASSLYHIVGAIVEMRALDPAAQGLAS